MRQQARDSKGEATLTGVQLGVVPNRPREINCRVVPVFLLGIRQLGCRLVPRRLFASSTQTFDYRGG